MHRMTLAITTILACTQAHAMSSNDLFLLCDTQAGSMTHATCEGYVEGVTDVVVAMTVTKQVKIPICKPDGVTVKDLVDLFVKRRAGDAARMKRDAFVEVANAIAEAYPCPGDPPRKY